MTKTETPTHERDAMKYETRTTSVTVYPAGESMYSELATKIEITDEAGGEFVEVSQSGRNDIGKIAINPEEWPDLREAINRMIQECRKAKCQQS